MDRGASPAPYAPAAPVVRPDAREWAVPLAVGVVVALAFTLTPTLRFMGWFLRSLFHETGHVALSWLSGCPAFPAISLKGHAAAFHKPQSTAIAVMVGLLLAYLVFWAWRSGRLRKTASAGLVLWALVTFLSGPRETLFLLAGHLGEVTFGAVFLRRALTGDAVVHALERPLYAGLGWYLIASNAILGAGLAFSASVRAAYAGNGSFGLENDYLRAARGLGVSVGALGLVMALVSAGVLAVAFRPGPRRATVTVSTRTTY